MAEAVIRQHITRKTDFYSGLDHVTLVADKLFLQTYRLRLLLVCHSTSSILILISYYHLSEAWEPSNKDLPFRISGSIGQKNTFTIFWRGGEGGVVRRVKSVLFSATRSPHTNSLIRFPAA